MRVDIVVLAAGKGTRMKSAMPKVLHCLAGRPLLGHVLDRARQLTDTDVTVVVGHGGSRVFLATARHWADPSTYLMHRWTNATKNVRVSKGGQPSALQKTNAEVFPDLGNAGTEDQFMYQDYDGNYHAYFHNMYGTATDKKWWLDATGGHAFSRDGLSWTWSPTSAYTKQVQWDDGTSRLMCRRERPALLLDAAWRVPLALFTAVSDCERQYLHAQPINQA